MNFLRGAAPWLGPVAAFLVIGCGRKTETSANPTPSAPPAAVPSGLASNAPPALPTAVPPKTWHRTERLANGTYTHTCETGAKTTLTVADGGSAEISAGDLRANGHVEVYEGTARHRVVVDAVMTGALASVTVGAPFVEFVAIPDIGLRAASACDGAPGTFFLPGKEKRPGMKRESRCPSGAASSVPAGCTCAGSLGTANPCQIGGAFPRTAGSTCVHDCWEP